MIGARIVIGEAVDADDIGAVREERFRERRPDETGNAGDERLHSFPTKFTSARGTRARQPAGPTVAVERSVDSAAGGKDVPSAARTTS